MFPTDSRRKAGFLAGGLTDGTPHGTFTTLVFPRVTFNHGHGYDNTTGVFTAPEAGTYVLLASVRTYGDAGEYVKLRLVQDGVVKQWVVRYYAQSDDHDASTLQVVLPLAAGSHVWVEAASSGNGLHTYPSSTTFSGGLLYT